MRFKALHAKGEASLTDAEKTEYSTLKSLADTAKFDVTKDYSMTDEDLAEVVLDSVSKQLTAAGLSTDNIAEEVKKKLGTGLTVEAIGEQVKTLLADQAKSFKIDPTELETAVKAALTAAGAKDAVSAESLKTALDEFAKKFRKDSKMEFEADQRKSHDFEYPIAHRLGNLSVAQKQLLNMACMAVSDSAIPRHKKPKDQNDGITEEQLTRATKNGEMRVKSLENTLKELAANGLSGKAITTGNAGGGAELMDIEISSDIMQRLYMASTLAQRMIATEIVMPTSPYKMPMVTTRPVFRKNAEATNATASTPGTGQPMLEAKKLTGLVEFSYEAEEDAIVPILPLLQKGLGDGAADALEDALINGDTTATHMDSDTQADAAHGNRLWKGFRKLALAVAALKKDLSSGNISATNFKIMRKALKQYGMNPKDLILIVGTQAYNEYVMLDEVLTIDKVGQRAGILTGVIPNIAGVDIIPSARCREDTNASGVYDGSTTTKGTQILAHLPSFIQGVKREFTLETDVDKIKQVSYVIASFRRDFIPMETPSAALPMLCLGYNFLA